MRFLEFLRGFFIVLGISSPAAVVAAPVMVGYDTLTPVTLETFEGHSTGMLSSPAAFSGFSYHSPEPVIAGISVFCGSADDRCLIDNWSEEQRTLDGFWTGTTGVGLKLHAFNTDDVFRVTVEGGSGSAIFEVNGPGALAFADAQGIFSLVFQNLGRSPVDISNYSFDDVITSGGVAPIPLPPAALLLIGGIASIAAVRRRRS